MHKVGATLTGWRSLVRAQSESLHERGADPLYIKELALFLYFQTTSKSP